MNDNEPPKMNIAGLHPDFGDPEMLFNMRNWLETALTRCGAVTEGAGLGMGGADLQVNIEGHLFNVHIRPING